MKRKLIFPILSVFLLVGCNKVERNYSDYTSYYLDSFLNVFSQKDEYYALYLYRETCPYCQSIKNDVLAYFDDNYENKEMKLYLYSSDSLKIEYPEYKKATSYDYESLKNYYLEGNINSIENLAIRGVPSLYVIKDYKVLNYFEDTDIVSFLSNF